jgi:hypothetical protein
VAGGNTVLAAALELTVVEWSHSLTDGIGTIKWCDRIPLVWEEVRIDVVFLVSSPFGRYNRNWGVGPRHSQIVLILACICYLFARYGVGDLAPFYTVFCVFALDGDARVNKGRNLNRIHYVWGEGVGGVNRTREVESRGGESWRLLAGLLRMRRVGGPLRFVGKS